MRTPEQFNLDIQKWVEKTKGRLDAFCSEFVQDINEEIVRATPVKTGFLRGSWWASIDAPDVQAGTPDPAGTTVVARLNLVALDFKPGTVYFAMNGAAYAGFVEYGTTKMTPRAFVRGVVARAQDIAEAAAQRVAAL